MISPEFWTPQVIASVVACCAWSVFLLAASLLMAPNLLTRTLCVCAVCGSMTACSAGFLGVTHIAEDRINQAVQLAANLERSEELLRAIEAQSPPPVIYTIDGDTIEIDEKILAVFRQHESKHDDNR